MRMQVKYSRKYLKAYKKIVLGNPKLKKRYLDRMALFKDDPSNPILRDHSLEGRLIGLRAFRVTGGIRVVYREEGSAIVFENIGTHSQVYGK